MNEGSCNSNILKETGMFSKRVDIENMTEICIGGVARRVLEF